MLRWLLKWKQKDICLNKQHKSPSLKVNTWLRSARNRDLSSQLKDFWFSEEPHITLQQNPFAEIQMERGAGQWVSEHRWLRAGLRAAQASPHSGRPPACWGTPGGCHPPCPGSLFNTRSPGVDTGAVVFHAAVKLPELFFQPGDTKANPGTLTEVPFNQQKTTGKMKVLPWWSTAVLDKWNIAINKVLIYCDNKKAGSGEEVGKGEKLKTYLGKEEK